MLSGLPWLPFIFCAPAASPLVRTGKNSSPHTIEMKYVSVISGRGCCGFYPKRDVLTKTKRLSTVLVTRSIVEEGFLRCLDDSLANLI